jgi:hypothetical protein
MSRLPEEGNCITIGVAGFCARTEASNVCWTWTMRMPGGGGVPTDTDFRANTTEPRWLIHWL